MLVDYLGCWCHDSSLWSAPCYEGPALCLVWSSDLHLSQMHSSWPVRWCGSTVTKDNPGFGSFYIRCFLNMWAVLCPGSWAYGSHQDRQDCWFGAYIPVGYSSKNQQINEQDGGRCRTEPKTRWFVYLTSTCVVPSLCLEIVSCPPQSSYHAGSHCAPMRAAESCVCMVSASKSQVTMKACSGASALSPQRRVEGEVWL